MTDMLETEYTVRPGRLVTGVTRFFFALFFVLMVGIPYSIYKFEGLGPELFGVSALLWAILIPSTLLAWSGSPQSYRISKGGVTIIRPRKPIFIPLGTITAIEKREFKVHRLVRKWGNGGLFSFTGTFWNRTDRTMWFCTRNSNFVMIHAHRKYVLSPDEQDMFMNQLQGHIDRAQKDQ